MEVSLTLIQTFYTVVQHGSYSAASRALGLSYQTAANHVRRLEQVVGGKLVESEKGSRQVTVTPRGRRLYKLLHPELDAMLQRLASIVRQERPVIRAGIPAAMFYIFMPPVLRIFRERHPEVEIQVYERDTVLAELIKNGGLDICMSEHFFGDSDVPQHLIGKYSLSLVYPASWGSSLGIDDFCDWGREKPFITFEPGQTLRNAAINFLSDVGVQPTIAITMSSGLSILRCVAAGLGYSVVPDWLLTSDNIRSEIHAIPLDQLPQVNLYFGYAGFLVDNIHVRDLHEICRAEFVQRFSK